MTNNEYKANLDRLMLIVRCLLTERDTIREMREIADRAETIGPFIDPTAWIHNRGGKNIAEQVEVLRILQIAVHDLLQIDALKVALDILEEARRVEETLAAGKQAGVQGPGSPSPEERNT